MKKMRFASCLMAIIMLVSLLANSASAAAPDIHLDNGPAQVYLDNRLVQNIDSYVDGFNQVRVRTFDDFVKVFGEEARNLIDATSTGIILSQYAELLGYTFSQVDNCFYLCSSDSTIPDLSQLPDLPTTPELPSTPDLPITPVNGVEVFVNGLRVSNADVSSYGGEYFINSTASLRAIFSGSTETLSAPTSVRILAEKYHYTLATSNNRLYLNNDGNKPIELFLNGKIVSFPDQQPIAVPPGRTMIPLRTISELVGATVEWDGNYNRIAIRSSYRTMILWLGNQTTWVDGNYYHMDVAPYAINGRTVLPIFYVATAFGLKVKWVPGTQVDQVLLTK